MRATVCKFQCTAVTPPNEIESGSVTLGAVYTDDPDDRAFSLSTPWGEMTFGLDNPALDGFFVVGEQYMITITKAED